MNGSGEMDFSFAFSGRLIHPCLCARKKNKKNYLFDRCNTNVLGAISLPTYLPAIILILTALLCVMLL